MSLCGGCGNNIWYYEESVTVDGVEWHKTCANPEAATSESSKPGRLYS
jgi:hypothetical protein